MIIKYPQILQVFVYFLSDFLPLSNKSWGSENETRMGTISFKCALESKEINN